MRLGRDGELLDVLCGHERIEGRLLRRFGTHGEERTSQFLELFAKHRRPIRKRFDRVGIVSSARPTSGIAEYAATRSHPAARRRA